jgi:glycosyltransferase involved in cell wall biosynthesis
VARRAKRVVQSAAKPDDAVILRIPSIIARLVESELSSAQHPFGVEVIGDPYDVFAPGVVGHPLRPFLRLWFARTQRRQCERACAAAYVTNTTLQHRYPCPAFEIGVSDAELDNASFCSADYGISAIHATLGLNPSGFVERPRQSSSAHRRIRLVTIGSMEQLYKAPDVLIRAVAQCLNIGLDLELVFVGDGKFRPRLESFVKKNGLADRVCFRGILPSGEAVRAELDAADLFVLPSRTEGLPRALIEAMARALPCIGSTAGGIPELLPPEDMVPINDSLALAQKIGDVLRDPQRMAQMKARNLKKAREYSDDVLRDRREKFYRHIKEKTETWLNS